MEGAHPKPASPRALRLVWRLLLLIFQAVLVVVARDVLTRMGILDPVVGWIARTLSVNAGLAGWLISLVAGLAAGGLIVHFGKRLLKRSPSALDAATGDSAVARRQRHESAQRAAYLRRVKMNVKELLARSIHHARAIDLKIDHDPAAVRPPWNYYDIDAKATYESVWDAFEKSHRRLLLLGHPGSGKTTAMLHLAERLIAEAEVSAGAPLPLILNLSEFRMPQASGGGWGLRRARQRGGGDSRAFETWVIAEIEKIPGVEAGLGRAWLEAGNLAILLDGLDEYNQDRRGELVQILNDTFLNDHADLPVMVCSRTNEYAVVSSHAGSRLELGSGVHLQPLTDDQIAEYLVNAQAEELLRALPNDPAVKELAKTPLTLSVLVLAYGGGAPTHACASLAETRLKLFESYVSQMLSRQALRKLDIPFVHFREKKELGVREYDYPPASVDRWLGWLALTMSLRSSTGFSPSQLMRLLIRGNDPRRDLLSFWLVYATLGLPMVGGLALIAFAIVPTTMAAEALIILSVGWLLLPWVAKQEYNPGAEFWQLAIGAAAFVSMATIFAEILAAWTVGDVFAAGLVPVVLTLLVTFLFLLNDDRGSTSEQGVSSLWVLTLAVPGLLAVLSVSRFGWLPDGIALSESLSIPRSAIIAAFAWLPPVGFLTLVAWSERFAALVTAGAGLSMALACSVLTLPTEGADPRLALATLTLAALLLYTIATPHLALFLSIPATVIAIAAGVLAGPAGAVGAVAGFIIASILLEQDHLIVDSEVEEAAQRILARVDSALLTPLAWVVLALCGKFPWRRGKFLNSVVDAFLLKRSTDRHQFVHLLLRNAFALRELTPLLAEEGAARLRAIEALGYQGEAGRDVLLELTENPDGTVRAAALTGLSRMLSPKVLARIIEHVSDKSPPVRMALIELLPRLSKSAQVQILKNMEPLGGAREIPLLLKAQADFPQLPKEEVWTFLQKMERSAVPALIESARNGSRESRILAIGYLAKLDPRHMGIGAALITQLRSRDPRIREAAARALKSRPDERALELLKSLIKDRDRRVREAARGALESVDAAIRKRRREQALLPTAGSGG